MDAIQTLALSMGIGWASGLNLYAAVFMLGLLHNTGNVVLPPDLAILADPLVLVAAGLMYCIEFFADKVPGLDTAWDAIHSFVRIPAGAVLAAGAVGDVSPAAALAAGLLGGTLAAGSHALKASSRIAINTSPEPFTNWAASLGEDALVIGGLWAALHHPLVFLAGLVLFVLLAIWLLPKLWRGLRRLASVLMRPFRGAPAGDATRARPTELPEADPSLRPPPS